jgi:hypothetical protein
MRPFHSQTVVDNCTCKGSIRLFWYFHILFYFYCDSLCHEMRIDSMNLTVRVQARDHFCRIGGVSASSWSWQKV